MNLNEARARIPALQGLDDQSAISVLQQTYYPTLDAGTVARAFGVEMAPPPEAEVKGPGLIGRAKDVGITALKGAIGVPEAAVGLADMVTGGQAGKAAESIGFRPKEAKAILDEQYSDAQKAAFKKVQAADGFVDTAAAALQNPSVIAHSVIESLPSMAAGGVVGRGVAAAAPRLAGVAAGAIGEGVVGAGSAAEQIRQQTPDGLVTPAQAGLAALSGAGTTAFGLAGGKLSQKLGIGDIDTALAGGTTRTAAGAQKGVVRRVAEGMVSEGMLEELPQSVQEQVLQNIALDKPLTQGVGQAAALGALSGAAMGGGFNVMGGHGHVATLPAAPLPTVQDIGKASTVDEAIAAAGAAVSAPVAPAGKLSSDDIEAEVARMEAEATQAAAGVAPAAPAAPLADPLAGDILSPRGVPFQTEKMAGIKARLSGGDVVPVNGGWVVRPAGAAPAAEVATPAAPVADTTGLSGMGGGMADAITGNLYGGLFDALKEGKTTMAGVKDPVLDRAKPHFDAGLIQSGDDIRRFENEGYPTLEAPAAPAAPETPEPIEAPAAPQPIALDDMPLAALNARLGFIKNQVQTNGGWNQMLIDERNRVQAEIDRRATPVAKTGSDRARPQWMDKTNPTPAQEPTNDSAVGSGPDRGGVGAGEASERVAQESDSPAQSSAGGQGATPEVVGSADSSISAAGNAANAEPPLTEPAPRVVTVAGEQVALTPEQATQWDAAQAGHDQAVAAVEQTYQRTKDQPQPANPDVGYRSAKARRDAELKRLGMELSAQRRKITDRLTAKERAAAGKSGASLRAGDRVTVGGTPGTIKSNAFGRISVQIDGEAEPRRVPREQIQRATDAPAADGDQPGATPTPQSAPTVPGRKIERHPVPLVRKSSGSVDINKTLAALPPIPEGHIRLFRGESPTTDFNDVFESRGLEDHYSDMPGVSYTPALKFAEYFRSTYGRDATMHYIDVPKAIAKRGKLDDAEYKLDVDALNGAASNGNNDPETGDSVGAVRERVMTKLKAKREAGSASPSNSQKEARTESTGDEEAVDQGVLFSRESGDAVFRLPDIADRALRRVRRPSVSAEDLRARFAPIQAQWKNGPKGGIQVVQSVDDLPAHLADYLRSNGEDGRAEGFYLPKSDRVFLIADNLPSTARAQEVAFHEVYGHKGMRAILSGAQYATMMERIRRANPKIAEAAAEWFANYGDDTIAMNMDAGQSEAEAERNARLLSVEEALADMAGTVPAAGPVKHLLATIQRALRAIGLDAVADWMEGKSEAETLKLLAEARAAVFGVTRDGDMHVMAPEDAPAYTRSDESEGQQTPGLFDGDPVEVTELRGEPFASAKGALVWALENLRKPVVNERTGWEISVARTGLEKALSQSKRADGGLNLRAIRAMPQLLERAVLAESYPDRGGDVNIKAIHRLYAPLQVGDRLYRAKLTVKEYKDGRRFYDQSLSDLEKESPEQVGASREPGAARLGHASSVLDVASTTHSPDSVVSIADLLRGAKRDSDGQAFEDNTGEPAEPAAGYGSEANTQSEGRTLSSHEPAQSVRDRILEAGKQGSGKVDGGRVAPQVGDTPAAPAATTGTESFWRWFGDSKAVNEGGAPREMYHSSDAMFTKFDRGRLGSNTGHASSGLGFFFTPDRQTSEQYGQHTMPVYLSIKKPYTMGLDEFAGFDSTYHAAARMGELQDQGYDGVHVPTNDTWIAFEPNQIKSATDNNGQYDADNPDIRFSRAAFGTNNPRDLVKGATETVSAYLNAPGKVSWWHKTVGTMYNLAQRSPEFRKVYDRVQDFINDVSYYANEAANLAPNIIPKLESIADLKKSPISVEDNKAISAPIFEGTLNWARDERGRPVKLDELEERYAHLTSAQKADMLLQRRIVTEAQLKRWLASPLDIYDGAIRNRFQDNFLRAGVVFTDGELRQLFNLNDHQISLYKEFRSTVDKSLARLAIADMLRYGGKDIDDAMRARVMELDDSKKAGQMLSDRLMEIAEEDPERADMLMDSANTMLDKADRAKDLMEHGYAPLSRFGHYTLDVVDAEGKRVYFGMFESPREANQMAVKMRANFRGAKVTQGTVSEQAYKLFAGVSPETLELFGGMLGLESQGEDASSKAFQQYLKLAKANRSAMKRLIQRKGIAGFSEDVGRVLAGFVYSNARHTASTLHMGAISEAVNDIPQQQGEIKDAAMNLAEYVKNPQEEAQAIRGLLFVQYLGGSLASAMVNMTQPIAVTMPYLSQFGGVTNAAKQMAAAVKDAVKRKTGDDALDAALKTAEQEGIVAPQEVHHLMAQAQGRGALKSGDGTKLGDARAAVGNFYSKGLLLWGKPFALAEQFNRRTTFIAAWRTAKEQGIKDPAKFAEQAITETQFLYNKGNKPQWARGPVGSVLFTFKQYSISYLELLTRMAKSGPEGRKAALFMLAMMMLMGGAEGLPFADDADDVIDGALQRLGYNTSAKQWKEQFFADIFGEAGGRFLRTGISGLPGAPIDVSGRLGMGNVIPGTGFFTKKTDYSRDILELAGPAGDFGKRVFQGGNELLAGNVVKGATTAAPKAFSNMAQAYDMYSTGMYRDQKGRKVIDVDGYDALAKAVGFQPNDVARVQDAAVQQQQMIAVNKMRESEIADKWAQGRFEKDEAKVQAAKDELKTWNERNPDTPIKISYSQIVKRVQAMNTPKAERIAKTAPKEIRASVKRDLTAEHRQ